MHYALHTPYPSPMVSGHVHLCAISTPKEHTARFGARNLSYTLTSLWGYFFKTMWIALFENLCQWDPCDLLQKILTQKINEWGFQQHWSEDGEMNRMTLPSSLKIRSLAVWGRARYLSVTKAPHNIESLQVSTAGKKLLFLWNLNARRSQSGVRTRDFRLYKQVALSTTPVNTSIWLTFVQCRSNVFDVGPPLYNIIQMLCAYWDTRDPAFACGESYCKGSSFLLVKQAVTVVWLCPAVW